MENEKKKQFTTTLIPSESATAMEAEGEGEGAGLRLAPVINFLVSLKQGRNRLDLDGGREGRGGEDTDDRREGAKRVSSLRGTAIDCRTDGIMGE